MSFNEENEISIKANGGTELTKRSLGKYIPEELTKEFQIIPSRVRDLDESKIRIYWAHDLPEDPEVNHLKDESSRNRFHKFVFSSNWQLNEFHTKLGFPLDDKVQVLETPLEPLQACEKSNERVDLIYFSTPQRGLELLVPVFEKLSEKYDDRLHLHVFSSFKIYGWEESDKHFEPLYKRIREHPKMTYHGFAPNDVVREQLLKSHILAYPNIWKETSCRVLQESMSARLLCVHPNLAALPDTSGGLTSMYQYVEDHNKHANLFYEYLDHAITHVHDDYMVNYTKFVKTYADTRFNINKISSQWKAMLENLLEVYPDEKSRKFQNQQTFVYRT